MKRVEIFAWKRKRTRTYFIVRGCKNIRVTNIFRSLLFFLFFSQLINFIVAFRGSRFVDRSRRKNEKWRRNEIESKNRGERRRIYRGKIANCSSCNAKKKKATRFLLSIARAISHDARWMESRALCLRNFEVNTENSSRKLFSFVVELIPIAPLQGASLHSVVFDPLHG